MKILIFLQKLKIMKNLLMLLLAVAFLSSCKKKSDSSESISSSSNNTSSFADFTETNVEDMDISTWEDAEKYQEATGDYPDGTYCADVEYYNPNTGTRKTYELDVEVENGDLVQINWSNGGWLDESHFEPGDISSGSYSFTSDEDYEYTVTLGDFGGC